MNSANYLEMLPLSSITKYSKGRPGNGLPFTGHPRVHPSEKNKLILVNDPLGPEPVVLEFKLEDVLLIEDIPSAVTEAGEGIPLVRLWIQKGAVGMILEPFEVGDTEQLTLKTRKIKERVAMNFQNRPVL
jgi:hypothetical protein